MSAPELTADEIERYAPYHTIPQFAIGYRDYERGVNFSDDYDGATGQAYDRGAECAMRRQRGQT
jgi:hypothetical protein